MDRCSPDTWYPWLGSRPQGEVSIVWKQRPRGRLPPSFRELALCPEHREGDRAPAVGVNTGGRRAAQGSVRLAGIQERALCVVLRGTGLAEQGLSGEVPTPVVLA